MDALYIIAGFDSHVRGLSEVQYMAVGKNLILDSPGRSAVLVVDVANIDDYEVSRSSSSGSSTFISH